MSQSSRKIGRSTLLFSFCKHNITKDHNWVCIFVPKILNRFRIKIANQDYWFCTIHFFFLRFLFGQNKSNDLQICECVSRLARHPCQNSKLILSEKIPLRAWRFFYECACDKHIRPKLFCNNLFFWWGSCPLQQSLVHSFCSTVLLRHIRTDFFWNDAFSLKGAQNFATALSRTSICLKDFSFVTSSSFSKS